MDIYSLQFITYAIKSKPLASMKVTWLQCIVSLVQFITTNLYEHIRTIHVPQKQSAIVTTTLQNVIRNHINKTTATPLVSKPHAG
jgi:hypothetical protein